MMELKKHKHIHLIGIGGVSMSAIAEILLHRGHQVTGSDLKVSPTTERLERLGATVWSHHGGENITGADLIIYTSAIAEENPEYKAALASGVPMAKRAEVLGLLMRDYKKSIAVSGAHGKTTTTGMIATILDTLPGVDPTLLVGGTLASIGGNIKIGKDDFFVTEACEYKENFLYFEPALGIILNIDEDHLDYYRDLDHIVEAFVAFSGKIKKNGHLLVNRDDYNACRVLPHAKERAVTFGITQDSDYQAQNITFNEKGQSHAEIFHGGEKIATLELNVPGRHNIYNALAAFAACHLFGLEAADIARALSRFTGTDRRFQLKGERDGIIVYDDYAHHPTEIKVTLDAFKQLTHKRLITLFQPHTYTRTQELFMDFASAFTASDIVLVSDIYAAREVDPGTVHARDLAEAIRKEKKDAHYMGDFEEMIAYLEAHAEPGDLVITMGAGDIYRVGERYLDRG
jgi:UDP-N-acetylmuramate--alanine ligase